MNLGGNELLIVLIIALVLFGGSQLPKIARNIGTAQKEFKKGLAESREEEAKEKADKADAGKASTADKDSESN